MPAPKPTPQRIGREHPTALQGEDDPKLMTLRLPKPPEPRKPDPLLQEAELARKRLRC